MRTLLSITAIFFGLSLVAQDAMQVTLEPSTNANCLSINLTSISPEDINLKGQNYRFFYDDSKLDFDAVKVNPELMENNFDAQVALHRDGLTKEINGQIPFETTMGFVSMNVMPSNEMLDHVRMNFWDKKNIADVCFAQEVDAKDVILANKKITSSYSKAFCVIDWEPSDKGQFSIDLENLDSEEIDE